MDDAVVQPFGVGRRDADVRLGCTLKSRVFTLPCGPRPRNAFPGSSVIETFVYRETQTMCTTVEYCDSRVEGDLKLEWTPDERSQEAPEEPAVLRVEDLALKLVASHWLPENFKW